MADKKSETQKAKEEGFTKAKWRDILREQLATRDNQAIKALLQIYSNQTEDEMKAAETREKNGVGFTSTDAEYFSSLAIQFLKTGSLSPKQLAKVKKAMPKYADQILNGSFADGNFEKVGRRYKIKEKETKK